MLRKPDKDFSINGKMTKPNFMNQTQPGTSYGFPKIKNLFAISTKKKMRNLHAFQVQ
jgi:hypothetical protein